MFFSPERQIPQQQPIRPTLRFEASAFAEARLSAKCLHPLRWMPVMSYLALPFPHSGHKALRKGRISMPGGVYLITATTYHRTPLFSDFSAACAASAAFHQHAVLGQNKLLAWVLMPDHVHLLLQLGTNEELSKSVGRMKAVSAREVRRVTRSQGTIWAPAFHDHALRHEDDLLAVARYIVANPLRAGLTKSIREYSYWGAVWI